MKDDTEDRDWQRLDTWLWCARFQRGRSDCARLAESGAVRVNRQPTDKAHARLRIGDVLTVLVGGNVRVVRVQALAARRGPASEALELYAEITDPATGLSHAPSCAPPCANQQTRPYRAPLG